VVVASLINNAEELQELNRICLAKSAADALRIERETLLKKLASPTRNWSLVLPVLSRLKLVNNKINEIGQ